MGLYGALQSPALNWIGFSGCYCVLLNQVKCRVQAELKAMREGSICGKNVKSAFSCDYVTWEKEDCSIALVITCVPHPTALCADSILKAALPVTTVLCASIKLSPAFKVINVTFSTL